MGLGAVAQLATALLRTRQHDGCRCHMLSQCWLQFVQAGRLYHSAMMMTAVTCMWGSSDLEPKIHTVKITVKTTFLAGPARLFLLALTSSSRGQRHLEVGVAGNFDA